MRMIEVGRMVRLEGEGVVEVPDRLRGRWASCCNVSQCVNREAVALVVSLNSCE
jgi:hypothetical protein